MSDNYQFTNVIGIYENDSTIPRLVRHLDTIACLIASYARVVAYRSRI